MTRLPAGNWPSLWALIRRGGRAAPGKRPPTKRAYITKAIAADGHLSRMKLILCDKNRRPCSRVREMHPDDIVKDWRRPPSAVAVERARRGLPAERDVGAAQ